MEVPKIKAMDTKNLFEKIPPELKEELFETLLSTENFKVERIVSKGHKSPPDFWYNQEQSEWILLLKGEARIQIDGEKAIVSLKAGDYCNIPAHVKHRVEWTAPDLETVWLAIFY